MVEEALTGSHGSPWQGEADETRHPDEVARRERGARLRALGHWAATPGMGGATHVSCS